MISNLSPELLELHGDVQQTLRRLVAKWHHGEQTYSRAELAFIGQWAHRAYMPSRMSNVQRHPILANLAAFAAVRALQNEHSGAIEDDAEHYYRGNLGNFDMGSVGDALDSMISSLKEFPYKGQAEMASRCFEVALQTESTLPVDRLNQAIRPYLPALIKLALRAYLDSKGTLALAVPVEPSLRDSVGFSGVFVTSGRISISIIPHGDDDITAGIIWSDGNLSVSINGFDELNELMVLVNAASQEEQRQQATGQRFTIFPPMQPVSKHVMVVGGVQIVFKDAEFDDLQHALKEAMGQPAMMAEYERLSWIYGEI